MNNGWIKLHRSIVDWEWYTDANTFRVFMHLLATANHKEARWRGNEVGVAQRITSSGGIADDLHLSRQQVRTSLKKLEKTEEITVKSTNKFLLITLVKWREYQLDEVEGNQQPNQQVTSKQPASNQQVTTNKNEKNNKNKKNDNKYNAGAFDFSKWPNGKPSDDFIDVLNTIRKEKKKPLSQIAINGMGNQLQKSVDQGYSLEDIFEAWAIGSWQGFKAEYMEGNKKQGSSQKGLSLSEKWELSKQSDLELKDVH
jgi:hypothetical protein